MAEQPRAASWPVMVAVNSARVGSKSPPPQLILDTLV
jgi:hypothetical protein